MLYYALYSLHVYLPPFRLFGYLTFRTAAAGLTALMLCLVLGPWLIRRLRAFQVGQQIREDGPATHQRKAGTPTMGGILVHIGTILPTILWANLANLFVWVAIGATLLFGLVGFADDYRKLARKKSLGLKGRSKLLYQALISLGVCVALYYLAAAGLYSTRLSVPFFKNFTPEMSFWHIPGIPIALPLALLVVFFLLGSSNAVNLTDGLDGLAAGSVIIAASALTVLCYVSGHARLADYLDLFKNNYAAELTVFCGSMVGATLGFLWYNAHPAEVFMGDVGSLSLGGAIGTVAVLIKQEFLLPMIGGLFVVEALSVILQVASFKFTGKRIFRMAPLHHHFELSGWTESQVVIRFWIAAIIFALFSLTTLKLR
ncbi:MAG: phospho-N-acetylmuramoyl-pentapeptide-transferase [Acidobacteriota bacterium]